MQSSKWACYHSLFHRQANEGSVKSDDLPEWHHRAPDFKNYFFTIQWFPKQGVSKEGQGPWEETGVGADP